MSAVAEYTPIMRTIIKGAPYVIGGIGGKVSVRCDCTHLEWDDVHWPTDDELSAALGVEVRFLEAGTDPFEALYVTTRVLR